MKTFVVVFSYCFLFLFLTSCNSQKDSVGDAFEQARDLHEKSNDVQEDLAGKAVDALLDEVTVDEQEKNQ